jgi:hypothetical protein
MLLWTTKDNGADSTGNTVFNAGKFQGDAGPLFKKVARTGLKCNRNQNKKSQRVRLGFALIRSILKFYAS